VTKLVLCPHFTAHVKDITATERVAVVCSVCGPKNWIAHPGEGDDPFESAGFLEYAEHVRRELIPMIEDSAVTMSLVPNGNKVDVKFAVELGYMIMLDKPIIAVVHAGCTPPAKLIAVSDELVEGEVTDPDFQGRLTAAMDRVTQRLKEDGNAEETPE
jgi:nucleoside 2-deoxyribosyltransferase